MKTLLQYRPCLYRLVGLGQRRILTGWMGMFGKCGLLSSLLSARLPGGCTFSEKTLAVMLFSHSFLKRHCHITTEEISQ